MSRPFQFKKFTISQVHAAMKVGTDGVILGAWASHINPKSILDIGCGTGLISLMMAQRYNDSHITAIDVDENAIIDSGINFKNSQWDNRLTLIKGDILDAHFSKKFDLIVSNPPFFGSSTPSPDNRRAVARNGLDLSIIDWLARCKDLLEKEGVIAMILPIDHELEIIDICFDNKLFINRICYIQPIASKKAHRILVEIQNESPKQKTEEHLIIEKDKRHHYTDEYIRLTRDFYLKMN